MTATAFFGYLFLSCGAPLAVWFTFIYPSSFLILTAITSMFMWLFILLITSAIFRGFVPLDDNAGAYAGMLLATVAINEVCRYGAWKAHCKVVAALTTIANRAEVLFNDADDTLLALSVGWGHGFTHVLFQFLPFLPMTWEQATAYNDQCPNMSIFMVTCLNQLGIFGVLTVTKAAVAAGAHVLFVSGMRTKRHDLAAAAPALHFAAALLTLLNFAYRGCYATVPLLLALGALVGVAAARIGWRAAARPQPIMHANNLVTPR